MKQHEKVRGTVQPEKLKIDEYSVWTAEKNTTLAEKLTDTQIALTEIYEGMVTA